MKPLMAGTLDSCLLNVQQNDFNKVCRAKPVLSKAEGTPRAQKPEIPLSSPFDKGGKRGICRTWRTLRLCASDLFSVPFSSAKNFKYLWLVFATLLLGTPVSAQTIKLGTVAPEGSPWHRIVREMGDGWSKATAGKIQLRIYPGGVAGDDPDMIRKMRVGQLQAAMLTAQGLSQVVPDIQALEMPLLLTNYEELDYVKERITPKLEPLFEAQGFTVLNWGEAGWVYFFTQKPVVRPEDLKPLRLFIWSGDDTTYMSAWKDAGYNPVPIPVTEILTDMQSGLINAFVAPPIAALSFQWFGLAKNMTDLKWVSLVGATVISSKIWREIPQETRKLLLDSAREASRRNKAEVRRLNETSIEVMKKHGLVVHPVPRDAFAQWETSARAGYPKLTGKVVSAQMVSEVERLRNEYRLSQIPR